MRQWNHKKLQRELWLDTMIYGTCFVASHKRKWWNPMRLLFGRYKLTRIAPPDFYKEFPDAKEKLQ